jgi:hypothetical protein
MPRNETRYPKPQATTMGHLMMALSFFSFYFPLQFCLFVSLSNQTKGIFFIIVLSFWHLDALLYMLVDINCSAQCHTNSALKKKKKAQV